MKLRRLTPNYFAKNGKSPRIEINLSNQIKTGDRKWWVEKGGARDGSRVSEKEREEGDEKGRLRDNCAVNWLQITNSGSRWRQLQRQYQLIRVRISSGSSLENSFPSCHHSNFVMPPCKMGFWPISWWFQIGTQQCENQLKRAKKRKKKNN